ncbi:MAG TPA: hypothetical protein PKK96_16935 [Anaerolineales bacterium]|jgi:hypothetical protein|nr:hypothetical protein [Anaerolineales bacterium]HNS62685.1 hypothetical protein [Anaerolineales bacterium]
MANIILTGIEQTQARKSFRKLAIIAMLLSLVTGCNFLSPTPTPDVRPLVDAFFSGYAYLDVNDNGEIDSEDTPIENATLIVTLQGGMEIGDTTDENGNAFITVPGGVDYPVTLRMEAPKDSNLKLIGPSSVTYPSDEQANFLFSSK